MATRMCPDCDHPVSRRAAACPRCGCLTSLGQWDRYFRYFMFAALVGLVIFNL